MEKRLDPNSDEFFEKYGFKLTTSMPHPVFKDTMEFKGLEANYVGYLERELEHFKKAFIEQVERNQQLQMREYYRLHDELKRLKIEKEDV